jgi:hypothetical protein
MRNGWLCGQCSNSSKLLAQTTASLIDNASFASSANSPVVTSSCGLDRPTDFLLIAAGNLTCGYAASEQRLKTDPLITASPPPPTTGLRLIQYLALFLKSYMAAPTTATHVKARGRSLLRTLTMSTVMRSPEVGLSRLSNKFCPFPAPGLTRSGQHIQNHRADQQWILQ